MTTETTRPNLRRTIIDSESLHDTFREDVIDGLRLESKAIPAKHLYDARGSELFERICRLDEYYPTRTERSILDASVDRIAEALGPDVTLIEPGAGSGEKAARLLERMDRPHAFVPIEISRDALEAASARLADRFPEIDIHPVCADFSVDGTMPDTDEDGRRVVYFPGSTIGNFEPEERRHLLERFRARAGHEGMLLIGLDLKKDAGVLRSAYNDADGVTAAFNENLLVQVSTRDAQQPRSEVFLLVESSEISPRGLLLHRRNPPPWQLPPSAPPSGSRRPNPLKHWPPGRLRPSARTGFRSRKSGFAAAAD